MAIDLNRDTYDSKVTKSELPIMVDFWGPKCARCLALMPAVDELEKKYEGKIKVAKVNATDNRMLCAKLRVMGLPAYLFYKGGAEVKRLVGEQITKESLNSAINEILS